MFIGFQEGGQNVGFAQRAGKDGFNFRVPLTLLTTSLPFVCYRTVAQQADEAEHS